MPSSIRFSVLFARQRLRQILLSRQNAEHRILPQLLVIVEVFVAQRQTVDPLREHLRIECFDQLLIPAGPENTLPARGSRFSRLSVWRSRNAPPSELIVPPSKRATISRFRTLQIRNPIGYTLS